MHNVAIVRIAALLGIALLAAGCASHAHRSAMCANPAKVLGVNSVDNQGGWILVRDDRSAEDTAQRIAATYHVRTQPLTYLHGFSTFPVPQEPKFLCDKAIVEVHYAAYQGVAAR
jgi:hypothetical protein